MGIRRSIKAYTAVYRISTFLNPKFVSVRNVFDVVVTFRVEELWIPEQGTKERQQSMTYRGRAINLEGLLEYVDNFYISLFQRY